MAIKDLAVCYNGSDNADAALTYAAQMGRKYGATLTGVYVNSPVHLDSRVERWMTDDLRKSMKAAEEEMGRSVEKAFRDKLAASGFSGPVEWLHDEGHPNDLLARHARYFDILLMGQFSRSDDARRHVRGEDIVLRSGKPLIIIPNRYEVRPFTEYAVVAWDGSRPAARALTDAMQILETKQRLDVVTVGKGDGGAPAGPTIITHLQRHGIDARQVSIEANRDGVGPTILDYCEKNDPDVLVMGAMGHARLREDLFGSLTRHILRNMTVPVLMAH
ncbi:MAG: universal stress protein [Alphaproteobacteria bacterium]|nr:universal stress protein [Alphaproteobacteria bacterium]